MDRSRLFHIVVAEPYDAAALARLEEVGRVTVLPNSPPETLLAAIPDAHALLIRGKAHVTARIIDAAPHLKVIGRASPTVDHIDTRAAGRRHISIVYTPNVAVTATAEFTLTLIMALHRKINWLDNQVRDGKFDALRTPAGRDFSRLTLGLLGLDIVAESLGRMCESAFHQPIVYHDTAGHTPADHPWTGVGFDELLARCDILSLHLPGSSEFRHVINAERLAKLKPTAILVNTSRGTLIDTMALAHALRKRHIAGAALDVFETEPLPTDHPIRSAPNCILTPHVAGATLDATAERFNVADDVLRVLKGEPPHHPFAGNGPRA